MTADPMTVQRGVQPGPAPRAQEAVTASCTLPGVAASAAAARRFTRRALECAGVSEAGEPGELCASELAANAVEHTRSGWPGGTLTLQVTVSSTIRIEVRDAGAADGSAPAVPAQCPPPGAESGRGLWLVAALADRFQFTPGRAWCELDLPGEA